MTRTRRLVAAVALAATAVLGTAGMAYASDRSDNDDSGQHSRSNCHPDNRFGFDSFKNAGHQDADCHSHSFGDFNYSTDPKHDGFFGTPFG